MNNAKATQQIAELVADGRRLLAIDPMLAALAGARDTVESDSPEVLTAAVERLKPLQSNDKARFLFSIALARLELLAGRTPNLAVLKAMAVQLRLANKKM